MIKCTLSFERICLREECENSCERNHHICRKQNQVRLFIGSLYKVISGSETWKGEIMSIGGWEIYLPKNSKISPHVDQISQY